MVVIYSVLGFAAAFLGIMALFRLPRFYDHEKGKLRFKKWIMSGSVKSVVYTCLGILFILLANGGLDMLPSYILHTIFSAGTLVGGLLSFVIFGYDHLKYKTKHEKDFAKKKEKRTTAVDDSAVNKIRMLRIQIQEEIKNKEQEARRMMNDTYLKESAKAEIIHRYADCVHLLQELYAEASNVLAYLETNGSHFTFDMDELYVSESKQSDLQEQLDKLRAFRQLNMSRTDETIEDLVRKYDADFQKIRSDGQRYQQVGR